MFNIVSLIPYAMLLNMSFLERLSCAVTGIREVQEIDRELVSGRQKDRSPIDWIEWQANRATPRVRMPARTTQMKIDELFAKVDRL